MDGHTFNELAEMPLATTNPCVRALCHGVLCVGVLSTECVVCLLPHAITRGEISFGSPRHIFKMSKLGSNFLATSFWKFGSKIWSV